MKRRRIPTRLLVLVCCTTLLVIVAVLRRPTLEMLWLRGQSKVGTLDASAIPRLVERFRHRKYAFQQSEATELLAQIHERSDEVLPALAAVLDDPEAGTYAWFRASWALGIIGQEEALPILTSKLEHPNQDVRAAAIQGLCAFEGAPVDQVAQHLRDDSATVFEWACRAVEVNASRSQGAIPVLIDVLNHPSADRRWRAARTLVNIGPPAQSACQPLAEAADKHDDAQLRRALHDLKVELRKRGALDEPP